MCSESRRTKYVAASDTLTIRKPKIVVVGSMHMDLTVKAKTLPRQGETVLGEGFKMAPGGKGANQAAAAARLGAAVTFVGRVGTDHFGKLLIDNANRLGINTQFILKDAETYTGIALITVDRRGNNIISVAQGADSHCRNEDVDMADEVIKSCDILLVQLEIPLSVVKHAVDKAWQYGVKVILNPAPAQKLPARLLQRVYLLTPNEREAELIGGGKIRDIDSTKKAARAILQKGPANVVITVGNKGAILATKTGVVHLPAPIVKAVDTTGAGDAFCGALAVAVSSGKRLNESVIYANCAGALATTRIGAQEALPTREELDVFMQKFHYTT
jgi:ribokinase